MVKLEICIEFASENSKAILRPRLEENCDIEILQMCFSFRHNQVILSFCIISTNYLYYNNIEFGYDAMYYLIHDMT
jgi:hypothetical protein